ncbi:DEKNAAC105101 [Brettanomyces naardenensis]|uniref:DEKNAAC105101 n=1 Tax=Brettanomyces naardenensis TaxID=13370 RepID=A0A448YSP1_BRENA|nr:DEKNAAC105101 [Brettanomyces naardenensis]
MPENEGEHNVAKAASSDPSASTLSKSGDHSSLSTVNSIPSKAAVATTTTTPATAVTLPPSKPVAKASFIKLPDTKNKPAASGLVTVVQEQAESSSAIHIMPPPPSPTPSPAPQVQQQLQQQQVQGQQQPQQQQISTSSVSKPSELERVAEINNEEVTAAKPSAFKYPSTNSIGPTVVLSGGEVSSSAASIQNSEPGEVTHFSRDKSNTTTTTGVAESSLQVDNPDSFLKHLRSKKSSLEAGIVPKGSSSSTAASIAAGAAADSGKQKRGSTTPSLLNMRAAVGQTSNGNTVSSTTTVQMKGSSRAEFFAAKLHDAIKDDEKNKSDSEEKFVYDTAPKNPQERPISQERPLESAQGQQTSTIPEKAAGPEREGSIAADTAVTRPMTISNSHSEVTSNRSETVQSTANIDTAKGSSELHSELRSTRPPLASIQQKSSGNPFGSTGSITYPITGPTTDADDAGDVYSRTSAASRILRKPSRMDSLSVMNIPENSSVTLPPQASEITGSEEPHNQLREITSRIFDSKGVPPRKYSGIDVRNFSFDEDDEDFNNLQGNVFNTVHTTGNRNNILGTIPSSMDYDSDIDEEYSITEPARLSQGYKSYGTFGGLNNHGVYTNSMPVYRGLEDSPQEESQDLLAENSNNNNITNHKPGASKLLRKKKNNIYFNPHNFTGARAKRLRQLKNFCYTLGLIFMLLSVGFIGGFILATSKDLQGTKVTDIRDVLISDEEFVFNMGIEAFNPGIVAVTINEVQLDVFAKTQFVVDGYTWINGKSDKEKEKPKFSTVLLGTIEDLDIPLHFQGGCFTRQKDKSVTEIKVVNPCTFDDDDNGGDHGGDGDDDGDGFQIEEQEPPPEIRRPSMKWLNISRNPFDLIVRGVLNYQLPISNSNRTVAISYSYSVDPDKLK